jgi:hypothetical protein
MRDVRPELSRPTDAPPRGPRSSRRAWLAGLPALLLEPAPLALAAPVPVQIAVIVGAPTHLANISMADLQRVFSSEVVTADDGTRLLPINHPPRTADRVAFDRLVLGRDSDAVGRFWIDRRIRGGSGPPRTVDNVQALRRAVSGLAGAISYLRTSLLTPDVRAVRVDGKLPGDPGYPLVIRP